MGPTGGPCICCAFLENGVGRHENWYVLMFCKLRNFHLRALECVQSACSIRSLLTGDCHWAPMYTFHFTVYLWTAVLPSYVSCPSSSHRWRCRDHIVQQWRETGKGGARIREHLSLLSHRSLHPHELHHRWLTDPHQIYFRRVLWWSIISVYRSSDKLSID